MSVSSMKISLLEFYKTREFKPFISNSLQKKEDLNDLLQISLDFSDQKTCTIGSWVCTHAVESHLSTFQAKLSDILDFLEQNEDQSSLRSWMKILSYLDVDEPFHGRTIDLCLDIISNPNNKVALQVYSMHVLVPLVQKYPELFSEIDALIQLHSMQKSPAYFAAYRFFTKKLKKYK